MIGWTLPETVRERRGQAVVLSYSDQAFSAARAGQCFDVSGRAFQCLAETFFTGGCEGVRPWYCHIRIKPFPPRVPASVSM
jgi:hypothetical protein